MSSEKIRQIETVANGALLFDHAVKRWYEKHEIPRLTRLFGFEEKSLRFRAVRVRKNSIRVVVVLDDRELEEESFADHCFDRSFRKEELFSCLAENRPPQREGFSDLQPEDYVLECRSRPSLLYVRAKIIGAFWETTSEHPERLFLLVTGLQNLAGTVSYADEQVFRIVGGNWHVWHESPDIGVIKRQLTVNATGDRFGMTVPPHYGDKAYFRKLNIGGFESTEDGDWQRGWRIIRGNEVGKKWPAFRPNADGTCSAPP